jgi:hypothetical protein
MLACGAALAAPEFRPTHLKRPRRQRDEARHHGKQKAKVGSIQEKNVA